MFVFLHIMFAFQLLAAMTNKLDVDDGPMPQDLAEGVDSDEWVSWLLTSFIKWF